MDKVKPLVSIIVPNYNHERYLEERLASIYGQTFKGFEVILLDDCSTDDSVEVLKRYASHEKTACLEINQNNSNGPFKQWDKGIALAKGEFIWIAETDDSCHPQFLEKLLTILQFDAQIGLAFAQSQRMNSEGEITGSWITHTADLCPNIFLNDFIHDGNLFIEHYLIHKNVIPNVSAVLFRADKLRMITPLVQKPFLRYNADWFYYLQISSYNKIAFLSEALNKFRYHDNSVISRAEGETGWFNIFKMELRGRKNMLAFIKNSRPDNFAAIEIQARLGNRKLAYLTFKCLYEKGSYADALQVVFLSPQIMKILYARWIHKMRIQLSKI